MRFTRNLLALSALAVAGLLTPALDGRAAAAIPPSQSCVAGDVLLDGYLGSTYVTLAGTAPDPQTAVVCVRVGDTGGALVVTAPAPTTPGSPSIDDDGDACATAAPLHPNLPAPLVSGQIAGAPFLVDARGPAGEVWLCLVVDTNRVRVVVPVPGAPVPPDVRFVADPPGAGSPPPKPWPDVGSDRCVQGAGGVRDDVLNLRAGDTHVWLSTWQESATRAYVCVRAEGAASEGFFVTTDTTGAPGVAPVLGHSASDMAGCAWNVVHVVHPVGVQVQRSPNGANPASVCVRTPAGDVRITTGSTGDLVVPEVSVTRDSS
jgi:hypothetical protein